MIVERHNQQTNFYQVIGEIVRIMALSDIHQRWTVADIERMVAAPIFAERALLYYDEPEGDLIAFISYAFLDDQAERHYIDRAGPIDPSVFAAKPDEGQLWFMDFIAPWGGVPSLMRHTKSWIEELYPNVVDAKYRRVKTGRIGRISAARPKTMH